VSASPHPPSPPPPPPVLDNPVFEQYERMCRGEPAFRPDGRQAAPKPASNGSTPSPTPIQPSDVKALLERFEQLAYGHKDAHVLFEHPWGLTDTAARVDDAAAYLHRNGFKVNEAVALMVHCFKAGIGAQDPIPLADAVIKFYRKTAPSVAAERGEMFGRLLVLGMGDINTAKARSYLLKGLISPAEISIWVGPPKCGKSFLMLYIAYMLSLGRSVFGRRVKPTKVLYVAAEGEAGIANRVRALEEKYGKSVNFNWIAQPADLLHDGGHKDELIAAIHAKGSQLVVLDTLSRLMAGGDENSPIDMGQLVANVAQVRHETGAHIAIVHHGTKSSNGSNPRGHSSLTGADDALVEVLKNPDGTRVATVIHAKDDADGWAMGFTLDVVELGTDEDGDPITTLVGSETLGPPPQKAATKAPLSANMQIALNTLNSAIQASGIMATVGEDFSEVKVVREAVWRDWFYREGKPGADPEAKRKAFRRAVDDLVAQELIGNRDELVWLVSCR
jgi:hypothetical protein